MIASEFLSSLKHYAGKHDQTKHGWRFGSNATLSSLRRQRAKHGDEKWQEYKRAARQRSGAKPAKEVNAAKPKKPKPPPKPSPEEVAAKKAVSHYDSPASSKHSDIPFGNEKYFGMKIDNHKLAKTTQRVNDAQADWQKSLSKPEIDALLEYSNGNYKDTNAVLRSGDYDSNKFPNSLMTKRVKNLDTALNRSEIPRNTVVYRGIDVSDETYKKFAGLEKGQVFDDPAYLSTSFKPGIFGSFSGSRVSMRIRVPKGSKGAYISNNIATVPNGLSHHNEWEVLLPRGTNFYVNARKTLPNGNVHLDVTVLP